jgi:outer membrane protein assembly factor BamB
MSQQPPPPPTPGSWLGPSAPPGAWAPPGSGPPPPQGGQPAVAPRHRRRSSVLALVAVVVVVVLVAGAVVVLRDDDDGGGAAAGSAGVPAPEPEPLEGDPVGEVVWELDDEAGRVLGTVGGRLLVAFGDDAPDVVVHPGTGAVTAVPRDFFEGVWTDGELLVGGEDRVAAYDLVDGAVRWARELEVVDFPGSGVVAGLDAAGELVVVDLATGEERWRSAVDVTSGGPWVDDGLVLWADAAHVLHAVDAVTGNERWTAEGHELVGRIEAIALPQVAGVEPDDGQVLVGTDDGALAALDAADGAERWTVAEWLSGGRPVEWASGLLVVPVRADQEAAFVVVDAATGEQRWRFDPADAGFATFVVAPGVLPGHLIVAPSTEGSGILDLATGAFTPFDAAATHDAAVHDDIVLLVVAGRGLVAVTAGTEDVVWEIEGEYSAADVSGSTFVVRSDDGDVVGLAAADGAERWRIETGVAATGLDAFVTAGPYGVTAGTSEPGTAIHIR